MDRFFDYLKIFVFLSLFKLFFNSDTQNLAYTRLIVTFNANLQGDIVAACDNDQILT